MAVASSSSRTGRHPPRHHQPAPCGVWPQPGSGDRATQSAHLFDSPCQGIRREMATKSSENGALDARRAANVTVECNGGTGICGAAELTSSAASSAASPPSSPSPSPSPAPSAGASACSSSLSDAACSLDLFFPDAGNKGNGSSKSEGSFVGEFAQDLRRTPHRLPMAQARWIATRTQLIAGEAAGAVCTDALRMLTKWRGFRLTRH